MEDFKQILEKNNLQIQQIKNELKVIDEPLTDQNYIASIRNQLGEIIFYSKYLHDLDDPELDISERKKNL